MYIIKSKLICFILLLSCLGCNVNERDDKLISFSEEWKADTTGCLGFRQQYISDSMDFIQSFVGKNEDDFLEVFGPPYVEEKWEKIYWIRCNKRPPVKGIENETIVENGKDWEAARLIVEVGENRTVDAIYVALP